MRPVPVGVVRTRDLSHLRSASLFWEGSGPHPSPAASAVGFIAGCGHRVVEFIWVRAVIVESGLIAAKHRRAVDSTVIEDAVAHQGMVTMLVAQIRRVPKLVPELGSGVGPRTQPRGWPAPV